MTIITTDIAGVILATASENGFKGQGHSSTLKDAQIKAVGQLLNKMAEYKGIEGVIICSQRAKIDMYKPKNTKANTYIAKLINNTQCQQN